MHSTLLSGDPIPIRDVPNYLPHPVNRSTVYRWWKQGVRGVRLRTFLIGGRRYTSLEALEQFVAGTTAAADGVEAPVSLPKQRRRAIQEAEKALDAAGI